MPEDEVLPHVEFVRSLYRELLLREPSDQELEHWSKQAIDRDLVQIYHAFVSCDERKNVRQKIDMAKLFVEPGHFYSPIVDVELIRRDEKRIFARQIDQKIDYNDTAQIQFAHKIAESLPALRVATEKTDAYRYYSNNSAFGYGDAIVLATMLMTNKPKHVVEVGSGYSSAMTLDVVERQLDWNCDLTFIEPFPQLLETLLLGGDAGRLTIVPQIIQDVDLSVFDQLASGDIYFVDTTHIVKTGSDVLHHFNTILPRLKSGVIIHIHDIMAYFEYPRQWAIVENRSWNEIYYVRNFLQNNPDYEILFFNQYMALEHKSLIETLVPSFRRDPGCSLWIRKR